ncbi:metallophosphoesterase 1 [Callorhinchus milii]|uniref:metallophosphoesterase 1 n=1 Tax=Callorhinchus milii TaxID=7868 RepID=UPI001C3F5729|nr:metallophosphoesterase 1 [Callorhinchus milii]
MERAFQTALWFLQPEIVFILGDLFDEGKWSSSQAWQDDVRRFWKMFRHPTSTELFAVAGNHDVGFHSEMNWYKLQRFEKVFNFTSAKVVTRKGINFVLVNSVALHGDKCSICTKVETELHRLSTALKCSQQLDPDSGQNCSEKESFPASAPVLLQHYPLYRASDAGCTGEDSAPPEEKDLLFRERYDVLSQEASSKLLEWFGPRLILSGHTHSGCLVLHEEGRVPEITLPSFSWRNRNNPSFLLATLTAKDFAFSKCFLPKESTVISVYLTAGIFLLNLLLCRLRLWHRVLGCAHHWLSTRVG